MRLLWIDDDRKLVEAGVPLFKRYGFDVVAASTVSRALTILRSEAKTLNGVLLDVRLGADENGIELLREINDKYRQLKVIIFTAYPDYADHIDAVVDRMAIAYLPKVNKTIPVNAKKQRAFFAGLRRAFEEEQPNPSGEQASLLVGESYGRLWHAGALSLLVFSVIIVGMILLSKNVSAWLVPIVLLAGILFYTVAGAFVLRFQGDYGLSQRSFLALMREALRYLPQLKLPIGKDKGT